MRFNRHSRKLPQNKELINRNIRFREILLIGKDGPIGRMSPQEAYEMAQNQDLDLVCVSPKSNPPICKIIDYGKYKFTKSKIEKKSRKNNTTIILKEVRITPNIGIHDLLTKSKKAHEFLADNYKVKVSLKYRGRERAHSDVGEATLRRFFEELKDVGIIEKQPYNNGRFFDMIIAPIKKGNKT